MSYRITVMNPGLPDRVLTEDEQPELERLQGWVGGDIELIPSFKKYNGRLCRAYCNEIKKPGMQPNIRAMEAWHEYLDATNIPWIPGRAMLVGPVVIVQKVK